MPYNSQNRSRSRSVQHQSQWRESLMSMMQPSIENSNSTEINIGRRLQELRAMQGLSIRALADISGLNFNTLSLIENEKSSPNVSTLQQLATALQISITAFFEISFPCIETLFFKKLGSSPEQCSLTENLKIWAAAWL